MNIFSIRILFILLALAGSIDLVGAQSLCGTIMLSDSIPASYATVYFPSLGVGATADVDGCYIIDDLADGIHQVEFSYMGYGTQRHDVQIRSSVTDSLSVSLQEQPVMLGEVFMTPSGEDPAEYILSKVSETAAGNRRRLLGYSAHADFIIAARDLDVIPMLAGKTLMFMLRSVLSLSGYGAMFDYCMTNSSVRAQMKAKHTFAKGKTRHSDQAVTFSNPPMDEKVQKQFLKTTAIELYDEVYDDKLFFLDKKLRKKHYDFRLCGTYEDGGHVIDVIEGIVRDTASMRSSVRLLVVEDVWGILGLEYRVAQMHQRTECREVVPGLYLPISSVVEPMSEIDLNSMIRAAIDKSRESEDNKKPGRSERKAIERADRVSSGDRQFRPSMSFGYTVRYSDVNL